MEEKQSEIKHSLVQGRNGCEKMEPVQRARPRDVPISHMKGEKER